MREKLIELLDGWDCPILLAVCEAEALADYLIENGVTVQRWIPVTERLPELGKDVLVMVLYPSKEMRVGTLRHKCGCYTWYSDGYEYWFQEVTHWMPLPTPPKDGDT